MNNNYVKRKLMKREEYYKFGEYAPFLEKGYSDLHTLITAKTKRIALLGDAGYGKSTELKTLTYRFLKEENQDFIPIFIELNTYVDEEIIDYVKGKIGKESESLLNYDKSKLVFLFDEFDQVMNKEIAVRKIRISLKNTVNLPSLLLVGQISILVNLKILTFLSFYHSTQMMLRNTPRNCLIMKVKDF